MHAISSPQRTKAASHCAVAGSTPSFLFLVPSLGHPSMQYPSAPCLFCVPGRVCRSWEYKLFLFLSPGAPGCMRRSNPSPSVCMQPWTVGSYLRPFLFSLSSAIFSPSPPPLRETWLYTNKRGVCNRFLAAHRSIPFIWFPPHWPRTHLLRLFFHVHSVFMSGHLHPFLPLRALLPLPGP